MAVRLCSSSAAGWPALTNRTEPSQKTKFAPELDGGAGQLELSGLPLVGTRRSPPVLAMSTSGVLDLVPNHQAAHQILAEHYESLGDRTLAEHHRARMGRMNRKANL